MRALALREEHKHFQKFFRMHDRIRRDFAGQELEQWRVFAAKLKDRTGRGLDAGVIGCVAGLLALGFPTENSCEGHVEEGLFPYVRVLLPTLPGFRHFDEEVAWWHERGRGCGFRAREALNRAYELVDEFSRKSPDLSGPLTLVVTRMTGSMTFETVSASRFRSMTLAERKPLIEEAKKTFAEFEEFLVWKSEK